MTVPGVAVPMAFAANPPSVPTKAQMEDFVHSLVRAIGTTGDARHKLAFAPTHLRFDTTDEEMRRVIHDAFAVARENDVAVVFHLDDSLYWGKRADLLSNPDNIETADWKQIPSTGRRVDWSRTPSKFAPQMCFNSPAIVAAVKARAALIGAEIKKELAEPGFSGREYLLAGVIAGSETEIGRDFDTDRSLGYRALSHRGFSESHPPKDADAERVGVVKEWIELWGNSLQAAGIPSGKVFCHIAFTGQGLDKKFGSKFAPASVAFSSAYRPGFSTYPEGDAFKRIFAAVAEHGSPGWISAEGANVSPTGMPGEPNMETYLGRLFNHGAVLVNVFSWGIGGEAMRDKNFFRKATESPECLAAYAKFLRGETLVESAPVGFSAEAFQDKMHRIQSELPAWVQQTGRQAEVMSRIEKIKACMKKQKWEEADKLADEILSLVAAAPPRDASAPGAAGAQDEEGRNHLLHELGGPFFVSRDKVQADLKLSDKQKQQLRDELSADIQAAGDIFGKLKKLKGGAREKLLQPAYDRLEAFLKTILTADQFQRFQQLKLQYDMPGIMLQPAVVTRLNLTAGQQRQFMSAIQEMQQQIEPLLKTAKAGGNPQAILPQVTRLRLDCQARIETLLTDTQKKQWQEMTGQPLVIW